MKNPHLAAGRIVAAGHVWREEEKARYSNQLNLLRFSLVAFGLKPATTFKVIHTALQLTGITAAHVVSESRDHGLRACCPRLMVGDEPESWWISIPSFEEGLCAESNKAALPQEFGATGEVKHAPDEMSV